MAESERLNQITEAIIGATIEVHRRWNSPRTLRSLR